jgi:glycosyltransferase involved in cell wall biosynthesis
LESVLAQTLKPVRIVVVDDGSSDASPKVIREFAQAHPEAGLELIEQANAGAHLALNRAVAAAVAVDFISILNSDDLYEPARFAECAAYLAGHPEKEVVCTGLRLIGPEGAPLPADHPKNRLLRQVWADPLRDPAEWLGKSNFTKTTSNYFIRAAYAREHPFRDYRYAHDYFFASVAALEGQFGVIAAPLLCYRTHPTNTIKADGPARVAAEVTRLELDLLREMAPRLAASPEVRAAAARYFRELLGNASDFRAEVFLALVARLLADAPAVSKAFSGLSAVDFPELSARPRRKGVEPSRSGSIGRHLKRLLGVTRLL